MDGVIGQPVYPRQQISTITVPGGDKPRPRPYYVLVRPRKKMN